MRHCGHCHTCGDPLRTVLDGEQWCDTCGLYRRYVSHGFAGNDTAEPDQCEADSFEAAEKIAAGTGAAGVWATIAGSWAPLRESEL